MKNGAMDSFFFSLSGAAIWTPLDSMDSQEFSAGKARGALEFRLSGAGHRGIMGRILPPMGNPGIGAEGRNNISHQEGISYVWEGSTYNVFTNWLVVWNICYFCTYWEESSQLTNIFSEELKPPNSKYSIGFTHFYPGCNNVGKYL